MKRREFITLLGCATALSSTWPFAVRAQNQPSPQVLPRPQTLPPPPTLPSPPQPPTQAPTQATAEASDNHIGQVATLQGSATVTRGNTTPAALKVSDPIYKNDVLQAGAISLLGVTFDDETTLNLNANARMTVDEFVYQAGSKSNAALFNVVRGTVAFVAGQAAKTGDMKFSTPTATLGIRGTTGVVEVPDGATGGVTEPRIKLYPDSDGRVGRIEVFDRQGARLGALTQGASAFTLRPGVGGRLAAVPFQIPPQEAARDRGVVQRLFASHNVGRQQTIQRQQQRRQNLQRQNQQRQNQQRQNQQRQRQNQQRQNNQQRPNNQQPNNQRPGGPQQQQQLQQNQNRNPRQQLPQQQQLPGRQRPQRGNRPGPNNRP